MSKNVKDVIVQGHVNNVWQDFLHALSGLVFLPVWYAQKWHKRDKHIWVFGAWSGLHYSDNSRALYEYVLAHCSDIRCVWITRNPKVYNRLVEEGKPVEMCESRAGKKIQKDAGLIFWTANEYDIDIRYINGARVINLWHGLPLKKIGEDAMERIRSKSLWKRIKTSIRKHIVPWEFIFKDAELVCGSPFFSPFFQSSFELKPNKIIINPEPRLTFMTVDHEESIITSIKQKFSNPMILMYMPTFRDDKLRTFDPFSSAGFDITRFNHVLQQHNIVFMYKGHFLTDCENTRIKSCERIVQVTDKDYDNLYTVLKDVDILITDYSSVYLDYIYLRKPMILFPFDYKDYIAYSREFYFDYNLWEAKKVYTWEALEKCLAEKSYYAPSESEIQRFRPIPISNCCEELVKQLRV